jgi:gluconate 5-dehydrogenase
MSERFKLDGRIALITGGARGLGLEIAHALGELGAIVYVNGTDAKRAQAAVERLRALGIESFACVFDVADESAALARLERIHAEHGRFDILFNNVGVRFREPLERIDTAKLRELLNTNLVAAFALARKAAALMAQGGYGRIINVSSVAGERGSAGDAAYQIAKAGMNGMTRALAAEFGAEGITCNALLPGPFDTETNRAHFATEAVQDWLQRRIILKRAGQPSEIGGAAAFLASPAASFVTGITMPVDGGYLAAG